MFLDNIRVSAAALTREGVRTDSEMWHKMDKGEYRIIYASPEILFHNASHFLKHTVIEKNAFRERLTLICIDEVHSIWRNGEFRPEFNKLGDIRDYLPKVPICAMSATLPPHVMALVQKVLDMQRPTKLITCPGRKANLDILIREQPSRTQVQALDCLIPETIQNIHEIPKTLVFVDSVRKALQIAKRLRNILSVRMPDSRPARVIRAYYSSIDAKKKKETRNLLENGESRIVVCTDSMSLGINIRDIARVIQWGVDEKLDLDTLWQRFGRAARDPEIQGLGVVYVPKDLLDPVRKYAMKDWEDGIPQSDFRVKDMATLTDEYDDENDDDGNDSDVDGIIPRFRNRTLQLFSLPVTSQTGREVRRLRAHMYRKAREFRKLRQEAKAERRIYKKSKSTASARVPKRKSIDLIDPALLWFLNTVGCRHRCVLSYLKYPDIFNDAAQRSWCCDNCAIQKELNLATLSTAGMSPADSIQAPHCSPDLLPTMPPAVAMPAAPPPRRLVLKDVLPKLVTDLKTWRNHLHSKLITRGRIFPGCPVQIVVPDSIILNLAKGIRGIHTIVDVHNSLDKLGYDLQSGILRDKDIADIFVVLDTRATLEAPWHISSQTSTTCSDINSAFDPQLSTTTLQNSVSMVHTSPIESDPRIAPVGTRDCSDISPVASLSHPNIHPQAHVSSANRPKPPRDIPTPLGDLNSDSSTSTLGGTPTTESPTAAQLHDIEQEKENIPPAAMRICQQTKRKRSATVPVDIVGLTNKNREQSNKRIIRPSFKIR